MADMRYANVDEVLSRVQNVVEFLDTNLTDVNQRGMFGNTPLKVAVVWGDLDAVRMLIDAGADVNAKNEDDFSALHHAAASGYLDIARLLVARGADRNAKNDDGETAFDLASSSSDENLNQLLSGAPKN